MIRALTERPVQAGEYVIRQGDHGDFFYIIDSGRFGVYVREDNPSSHSECLDGEEKTVFEGSGSFGELALMLVTGFQHPFDDCVPLCELRCRQGTT